MKELQLIDEIRKRAGKPGKGLRLGIGDDCAVLDYNSKKYLLWATDMLVEDTHFNLKKTTYVKIGRKAVAVNISDIAAMGGLPQYITVTIGVPAKMNRSAVRAVYDGIFKICGEYNIKVVGGDTNRSDKLVIDVSIIGFVEKKCLVRRCNAKEEELILITGPVRNGRKEHLDFIPRVKEARFLTENYKVSSMIDVSDGIAMDMGRICSESNTGCRLYSNAIPLFKGLSLKEALYFGESFELLCTMSAKETRKLFLDIKRRRQIPVYFLIGEITRKRDGLCLVGEQGRVTKLKQEGFRHL